MKIVKTAVFVVLFALLTACGGGGGGASNNSSGGGAIPPLIASFTPTVGSVGTNIQITGVMFGSTVGENTVRFNGVTATVVSATDTQLVVQVPAGAKTGPVQVLTSGGSATSSQTFTFLADTTTPGIAWTTRLKGPDGYCSGLAWNGTRLVAAGDTINTSTDTVRWDELVDVWQFGDIAWDGHIFMLVGSYGFIETSGDGLTWTVRSSLFSVPDADLHGVASSGARWVAVGASGTVRTSTDTINWTTSTTPTTKYLSSVAWTGSQFVAVGDAGTIITSPDGITWTDRTSASGTTDPLSAVGATSSMIVASVHTYNGSTSGLITSPDGITWTPHQTGLGWYEHIIFAEGKWLAVGQNQVAASTDGLNWTVTSDGPGNAIGHLYSVVYTGSSYLATGLTNSSAIQGMYTSPDGVTWTLRVSNESYLALARSTIDGRLVAVAQSGISIASTDSGVTWQFGGPSIGLNDVKWFASLAKFVAVTDEAINTSSDGLTWTRLAHAPWVGKIGASPTLLVNYGSNYVNFGISTSPDGINWTQSTGSTTDQLTHMFWSGSQFIGIGNNGVIITSPTGSTWTKQASNVTASFYGAASSPSLLVVVGSSGTILTSSDNGLTWVARTSGTSNTLKGVTWTGAEFVAVGASGTAVRSTDGITWAVSATPYSSKLFGSDPIFLNDLLWTGTKLVVVGTRGLVATSP